MKKQLFKLVLLSVVVLFSCTNFSENAQRSRENKAIEAARKAGKLLTGKVVGVSDGDTFKLLVEGNKTIRVRLHGIDAPEKAQDYGTQAKQALSDLIFPDIVDVIEKDRDRYGRTIGIVYADGINVNEELLKEGMVWHYTDYDKNRDWAQMQEDAKSAGRGLWSKADPTPPWEWRKAKRTRKAVEN